MIRQDERWFGAMLVLAACTSAPSSVDRSNTSNVGTGGARASGLDASTDASIDASSGKGGDRGTDSSGDSNSANSGADRTEASGPASVDATGAGDTQTAREAAAPMPAATPWIVQAESHSTQSNTQLESGNTAVGSLDEGDYVAYAGIDLSGVRDLVVRYAKNNLGGTIEVRMDGVAGTLLGTFAPVSTGGWSNWRTQDIPLTAATGVHTVYLVAKGGSQVMNLDWFQPQPVGAGGTTPLPFLHPLFANNMVLQRDLPFEIWGRGAAGEKVTVTLAGLSVSTVAGADGQWHTTFPAMTAGGPYTMVVNGTSARATLTNVAIGEVWICSGQSNMEYTLGGISTSATDVPDSINYPDLRLLVVKRNSSLAEESTLMTAGWQISSPMAAREFSAVCFVMGRLLQKELKVPVGLIDSAWGGTVAEWWTSARALGTIADFTDALARVRAKTPQSHTDVTLIYNGMISPLVRYRVRGVAWYQGEFNSGNPYQYRRLLPTMITDWRSRFGMELPFAIVQLPNVETAQILPVETTTHWAGLREAQMYAARELPRTSLTVTVDTGAIGAAVSTPVELHPRNKADVGKRLAETILASVYGGKQPLAPTYDRLKVEGASLRVSFRDLRATDGLMIGRKASYDPVVADPTGKLTGFAVAGADQAWVSADVSIEGPSVVLSSPQVTAPVAARYGWGQNPLVNLYTISGVPVSPFRTDLDYGVSVSGATGPGISGGRGAFAQGRAVTLQASVPGGRQFDRWIGDVDVLADATSSTVSFVMPPHYVSLRATFR